MNFPLFPCPVSRVSPHVCPTTFANEFIDFDYHMTSSYMITRRCCCWIAALCLYFVLITLKCDSYINSKSIFPTRLWGYCFSLSLFYYNIHGEWERESFWLLYRRVKKTSNERYFFHCPKMESTRLISRLQRRSPVQGRTSNYTHQVFESRAILSNSLCKLLYGWLILIVLVHK